jgi:hypothetical protein
MNINNFYKFRRKIGEGNSVDKLIEILNLKGYKIKEKSFKILRSKYHDWKWSILTIYNQYIGSFYKVSEIIKKDIADITIEKVGMSNDYELFINFKEKY